MSERFSIGRRNIGAGAPVFIVAEISGNHNGDIKRAIKIIDAAADAGADAIKLQTYTPDTMTIDIDTPPFIVENHSAWKGRSLYDLYKEAYTPWEWHKELFAHAKLRGMIAFSTPFDESSVAFLEKLRVPLYKVASFEVVDIPLLEAIGKTKKPVIMSRGMASEDEIALAIRTLRRHGSTNIVVLQCVSAYPARSEDMHLATIPDIRKRFKVLSGLSDHTLSNDVVVASVALGASVVEKHMTLRRADGGPDAAFSLEPHELKVLVDSVRATEKAVGLPSYAQGASEAAMRPYRRSLFVVADIEKGERFTRQNMRSIRPGNGLAPRFFAHILGKVARTSIKRGTPLSWKLIEGRPRH